MDKMDDATRTELVRRLTMIMPRLFDDDPVPAIGRLRVLAEKHGLHPTQIGVSIFGVDQIEELQREKDEAIMASWRDVGIFTAAAQAKGYVGVEQMAKAVNVAPSMVKDWKALGTVPAVFFKILADAPTRRDREKEIRALMAEAKRRVRAENKRRAPADHRKTKPDAHTKLAGHSGAELPGLSAPSTGFERSTFL